MTSLKSKWLQTLTPEQKEAALQVWRKSTDRLHELSEEVNAMQPRQALPVGSADFDKIDHMMAITELQRGLRLCSSLLEARVKARDACAAIIQKRNARFPNNTGFQRWERRCDELIDTWITKFEGAINLEEAAC